MKSLDGMGRRPGCFQLVLKGVLLFVVLFLFRYEIGLIFKLVLAAPKLLMRQPVDNLPAPDVWLSNLLYMAAVLIGVAGMVALIVFLVGRWIMPVRSTGEQMEIMRHFLDSLFGTKPLLVRVREGLVVHEQSEYPEEAAKKIRGGSILLVDLNSAVVLEGSAARAPLQRSRKRSAGSARYPLSRVGRPGLVFVHHGERLRGTVSLRRQFRINLNVFSHTSDGIELRCHVLAIFSLGQPPSIFKVAYCGELEAASLRVVQINPITRKIQAITDDLDEADKAEIHAFGQNFVGTFGPLAPLEMSDASQNRPPYSIDDQRIFSAVYSQARQVQVKEGVLDTWADLPAQVATEIFRNMISTHSYNAYTAWSPAQATHY
jgi:hypothetical protein